MTKQLRELERDGFPLRYDYKEVPPRLDYSLTDKGKSFMRVLKYMQKWGEDYLGQDSV